MYVHALSTMKISKGPVLPTEWTKTVETFFKISLNVTGLEQHKGKVMIKG